MKLPFGVNLKHIRSFLIGILLFIQIFTIITIPELLLLFYLAEQFGKFTIIAMVAVTSLLGLFLATNSISSLMRQIKAQLSSGRPPRRELSKLALLVISGYLLIAPGLISFVLGALMYYTPLNIALRKIIYKKFESKILVWYYYMKIGS